MTWHSFVFLLSKTGMLALLALSLFAIWWLPHRGWTWLRTPAAAATGSLRKGESPFLHRVLDFAERHFVSSEPSLVRLSIGGIFVGLTLWRFVVVLEESMRDPKIVAADLRIHNTLRLFNSPGLERFYGVVSDFGSPAFILPVAATLILLLWLARQRRESLFVALSVVLSASSSIALTRFIDRPRPLEARMLLSGPTLPSSHPLLSVCFYGFMIYLLTRDESPTRLRWTIIPIAILVSLVPIARIYLGDDWAYDTVARLFLGTALLGMLILAFKFPPLEHDLAPRSGPPPHWFPRALGATVFAAVGWGVLLSISAPPVVIRPSAPRPLPVPPQSVSAAFPSLIPKTSEDLAGGPMEPIAFLIVGDGDALRSAFSRAGWATADNPSVHGLARELAAVIGDHPDPRGPATLEYYDAQPQDLTFEKPGTKDGSIRYRHHIRIWKTRISAVPRGDVVWVGTSSYDEGVEMVPKPYLLSHRTDPEIDHEREWIVGELTRAGATSPGLVDVTGPRRGHDVQGDSYETDGRARVMLLATRPM